MIWEDGEQNYPLEGVGLMLGHERGSKRLITDIAQVENRFDPSEQHHRYSIDPMALLQAELEAERKGMLLLGIYHSHPDHPAIASDYDLKMAVPWYSYLITSIQCGKAHESRVWRLQDHDGTMVEEELCIQADGELEGS